MQGVGYLGSVRGAVQVMGCLLVPFNCTEVAGPLSSSPFGKCGLLTSIDPVHTSRIHVQWAIPILLLGLTSDPNPRRGVYTHKVKFDDAMVWSLESRNAKLWQRRERGTCPSQMDGKSTGSGISVQ